MDETDVRTTLWARLVVYYAQHMPDKLTDKGIAEIIGRYSDKEAELSARLKKKYADPLPKFVTEEVFQRVRTSFGLIDPEGRAAGGEGNELPTGPVGVTAEQLLDFRSPHFDPILALRARRLDLPVPNATRLDNISMFRTLLPPDHPDYVVKGEKKSADVVKAPRRSATEAPTGDPLMLIMEMTGATGPHSLLLRLVKEKRRACVMVRSVAAVRGICSGLIKAFDKHFNIVLMDVTEVYTSRAILAKGTGEGTVQCERYLKQLLIRGDNVVLCWEEKGKKNPRGKQEERRR